MIKKTITMISPLALRTLKPRWSIINTYKMSQIYCSSSRMWFCDEKNKHPQETERKQQKNRQPQKEEESPKKVKLTQLSTEELVEINSQESLKIVQNRVKDMQKQRSKNQQRIKQLQKQLEFLQKHHNQLTTKEQTLLQNLKEQEQELKRVHKRSQKQIEYSKDYAITKLAKQLIETADNIKRCKDYAQKLAQQNPQDLFIHKIILSHKQMAELLKLYDIQEFDPTGEVFDPNHSESLVTIPCPPGYEVNRVAMAMQTGYRIKSRILRSARVGIFV